MKSRPLPYRARVRMRLRRRHRGWTWSPAEGHRYRMYVHLPWAIGRLRAHRQARGVMVGVKRFNPGYPFLSAWPAPMRRPWPHQLNRTRP